MATSKGTRSRSDRKRPRFPEVKGKIVNSVEVDAEVISILFKDQTALSFDVDSCHVIYPELSDWRTGNGQSIKKWPEIRSKTTMVKWP